MRFTFQETFAFPEDKNALQNLSYDIQEILGTFGVNAVDVLSPNDQPDRVYILRVDKPLIVAR